MAGEPASLSTPMSTLNLLLPKEKICVPVLMKMSRTRLWTVRELSMAGPEDPAMDDASPALGQQLQGFRIELSDDCLKQLLMTII